ncbi:MAG: fibronectin type III domain-containing protein [Thermoanaerobaculaceae bacterium]
MAFRAGVAAVVASILGFAVPVFLPQSAVAQTCTITCTPVVPATVQAADPYSLKATYTESGCSAGEVEYDWTDVVSPSQENVLCEGRASGGTIPDCTKTRYATSTINWKLAVAKHGQGPNSVCVKTGVMQVNGFYMASLRFRSDAHTKNNDDSYTLTGNVTANQALRFSGPVTLVPHFLQGYVADVFTDGSLTVATSPGPTTITSGTNQHFWADGGKTVPTLAPQLANPFDELGFKLNGIPLYLLGDTIGVTNAGVVVLPKLFVGKADGFHLAVLRADLGVAPSVPIQFVSGTLISGDKAPGVVVEEVSDVSYDPVKDELSATLELSFPFLKVRRGTAPFEVPTAPEIRGGYIDALSADNFNLSDVTVRLGEGTRPHLWLSGLAIENICNASAYAPLFAGDLYFHGSSMPNGQRIMGGVWRYQPPAGFTLLAAGSATLLMRPVESPRAVWANVGSYETLVLRGSYGTGGGPGGGDILRGTLTGGLLYSPTSSTAWTGAGRLDGTLALTSCTCPADDDTCATARLALLELYKGTSTLEGKSFKWRAGGWMNNDMFVAAFTGDRVFDGLSSLAVQVGLAKMVPDGVPNVFCALGSNLVSRGTSAASALAETGWAAAAVERSVVLVRKEELAVFGVEGPAGTLPSIYLRTPSGQTITPATVGQLAGATYASDADEGRAVFAVKGAAAGTWVVGEDNLPAGDVAFTVLAPQAAPVTSFTSAQASGSSVAITASVSPASADTTVTLAYSRLRDGVPQGIIASELPATSGNVSATWDMSPLPSGAYYLFAVTDDGKNVPVTTFASTPVSRDVGGLAPPSGLAAVRFGDRVTLTWTASPSQGVVGYVVQYTDDPTQPGYPESLSAPQPTSATVTGLTFSRSYRFCVSAYDLYGNQSLCSNAVEVGQGKRTARRHLGS